MTKAGLDQVAVFWDFENCRLPCNVPGNRVIERIRRLVQHYGSIVAFKAYMDLALECANSRASILHSDLQSSGVSLVQCPHNGKKDVADKMMIVDMLVFAIENPPPATIVIITGDRDFAYAAAVLRLRGYHTIVISPPSNAHASIKLQASLLYDWQKDVLDGSIPAVPQSLPATAPVMDTAATSASEDVQAITPRACTYIGREFLSSPPDNCMSRTSTDYRHRKSASMPCPIDSLEPDNVIGTNAKLSLSSQTESHGKVTWPNTSLTLSSDKPLYYQGRDMRSIGVSTEPYFPTSPVFSSFGTSTASLDFETASSFSETDDDGLTLNTGASPSRQSDNSLPNATSSTSVESILASSNLQLKSSLHDGDDCAYAPSRPGNDEVLGETADTLDFVSAPVGRRHSCPPSCPAGAFSQAGTESGPNHLPTPERTGLSVVVASSTNTHAPAPGSSTPVLVQKDSPTRVAPAEMNSEPPASSSISSDSVPGPPCPTRASRQRFQLLIFLFIERRASNRPIRLRSSEVAVELLKRDPHAYKKAGVDRLKTLIEEARKAGVIVGPGLDKEGSAWVEINPIIYPPTGGTSKTKTTLPVSPTKKPVSPPISRSASSVKAIFIPLIKRLQAEAPSYRMFYHILGRFVKTSHPKLYKQASVLGLTSYLEKAEKQGIVRLGSTSGTEWVELMPAHRKPYSQDVGHHKGKK